MAATNSELEPILPSRISSARYDSFGTQSFYPTAAYGPESEENYTNRRPLEADNRFITSLRNRLYCLRDTWQYIGTHPTSLYVSRYFALSCLALLLWGNTFVMVGDAAGPGGQLFRIGVLGVAAYLTGSVVSTIGLPPLLGMLLMGTALRNTQSVVLSGRYLVLAANLRKVALVIILTRAGLGLDPTALKRLSGMVIRLAVIPSLVEASSITVMSHFLLGLPWIWGCLLGAVMAAVSPAVVIPCLFSLQDRGYGKSKGIPTLVIAAATFDDVIAISAFSVVLSIIFSTGDLITPIIQGPLGLISGFIFGIIWGLLIRHVPERHDRFVVILRTLLLGGGGVLLLFGSEVIGYVGAGPLGCVVAAFVANHGWRSQGWAHEMNPVSENFAVLWTILQPLLFGLIGNEIDLYFLDLRTVGLGVACLAVSLTARILISVVAASGGNLNLKEKLFVSWAWFPKATVQAAIGPVALDIARKIKSVEDETYASKLLIVAVLAILITAPIGATLITVLGPRLLEKEETAAPEPNTSPGNQSNECVTGHQTTDFF